jgi:nucleoside-diphosphate-sugar epimerase
LRGISRTYEPENPKDYRHGGLVPTAIKGALDISRARAELGYEPKYDIQKGIVRPGTFDHTILDGWFAPGTR